MTRHRLSARGWPSGLCGVLALVLGLLTAGATGTNVTHAYRWMVSTAAADRPIAPPLEVVWQRSPIWFERWNPAGSSESPSRRLAPGGSGLVTVLRRKLHVLDWQTGRTVWTCPLQGDEIFDWKLAGNVLVYASYGHDDSHQRYWGIRAAIDLRQRRQLWAQRRSTPYLRKEWILIHDRTALFGDDRSNELSAFIVEDGTLRWRKPQRTRDHYSIQATWFARADRLYALAGAEERSGLFLKIFEIDTGEERPLTHLIGRDAVSNLHAPSAVTPDGRLFVEYYAFRSGNGWMIAYDLEGQRLLWATEVVRSTDSSDQGVLSGKKIVLGAQSGEPLVATYRPNRYLVLNPATGAVLKDAVLPGYVGWTEHNAVLYSYPYLFTSARRAVGTGQAYDLIALNLDTGKIDWSYEIERRDERFLTASAEILNFLVEGGEIYLSRTDARVMAFRSATGAGQRRE
jgi:outer membrane protein assembly factor BamB